MDTYIFSGAASEINISSEAREEIVKKFEDSSRTFTPADLFHYPRDYMLVQLKNEVCNF